MIQPIKYSGSYPTNWAGYKFKEALGYTSGRHTGVDYNGPGAGNADLGQPVVAIAKGVVKYVADRSDIGFGRTIIIEHPFGVNGGTKSYSRYMHLQSFKVKNGQAVKHGQQIGTLGNSGTKYAHLHLDLWSNKNGLGVHTAYHKDTKLESYVDPFVYISKDPDVGKDVAPAYPKWVRVKSLGGANVRSKPTTASSLAGSRYLPFGTPFRVVGVVAGQAIGGNNRWYKSIHGNFIWQGNIK